MNVNCRPKWIVSCYTCRRSWLSVASPKLHWPMLIDPGSFNPKWQSGDYAAAWAQMVRQNQFCRFRSMPFRAGQGLIRYLKYVSLSVSCHQNHRRCWVSSGGGSAGFWSVSSSSALSIGNKSGNLKVPEAWRKNETEQQEIPWEYPQ